MIPLYCSANNQTCTIEENVESQHIIPFTLEDLEINKDGIFVLQKGVWVQLRTIIHNSDGSLTGSYIPLGWTCPKCKNYNGATSTKCRVCGYVP